MKKLKSFYNDKPFNKDEKYINEKNIYEEMKFDTNICAEEIDINKIKNRKVFSFVEKDYNKPQNIFFIKLGNITIFGRKLLSELRRKELIPSINCSLISECMIIGIIKNYKKKDREIIINYYPFKNGEKKYLFNSIRFDKTIDIYHPFRFFDYETKTESDSPIDGWKIRKDTKNDLFNGEIHLRKYTLDWLKTINVKDKSIFFDPACSTGDFLKSIKEQYPNIITIGQDLGKEMVECAKDKLDIVYYGDALHTPVKDNSVDFMFLRFLNFRVVTTEKARNLYKVLSKKVKKGGYVVCFGHTPVLLTLEELEKENMEMISCHGYNSEYNSIFQYYIFRKVD